MIIINPGSTNIPGQERPVGQYHLAAEHMPLLCAEVAALLKQWGRDFSVGWCAPKRPVEDEGRWKFWVVGNGYRTEVWIPGYPLDTVHFLDVKTCGDQDDYLRYQGPDQNPWEFYRLYTGPERSSWLWGFALPGLARAFAPYARPSGAAVSANRRAAAASKIHAVSKPVINPVIDPACVPHHTHDHEKPEGYLQRFHWAKELGKTHKQTRCPVCGLWVVWVPKNKPQKSNQN